MARLEIDLVGNNSSLIKSIKDVSDAFKNLQTLATNVGKLKIDLSLGDSINNLKTLNKTLTTTSKLYNDLKAAITAINSTSRSGITGGGTKAALDAQKLALAQSRTETQRLKEETARLNAALAQLRLTTAQNRQGTVAAIGSYKEAQQRLTALGRAIRESAGGFDSTNPRVKAQIAAYRALNEELKKFDRLMGNNHRDIGNYRMALDGLGGQITSLVSSYLSLYSAINLAQKAFSTAMKVDALQASFGFIISDSVERIEALRQQSNRLGVDFLTLTETNKKFIAAAKASNFSLTQADKIFNSVANAGAKLKLSNEQIGGTFLAIEQMISKGTVSMEELRRQLGDRLPGTFALAAKAMGKTELEFNKMVANGEVLAKDLLPRLADELDKTYGNDSNKKIESLQASTNRLNNTFTEIVMNSGVQSYFREIVDSATAIVGIFNRIISTPLSDKLQEESRELAIMRLELDSTNTTAERRLELIQSLVAKYPAYLSHIDTEKITNSELLPILEKINASYAHRIAYQRLMEKAGGIAETQAQIQLDRFEAQQRVLSDIAKTQELINKYGIDFTITGSNEIEKAQNIINGLRKAAGGRVETNTLVGSVIKSLETGVGYLNLYDSALEKNGQQFDEASKKARLFAESVGMFDGTARDATTQLDALQKTMLKIQDSDKLTRNEKNTFAHRLALAGYDAKTQKQVLTEVERLEIERAEKAYKAVKSIRSLSDSITGIFNPDTDSSNLINLEGLDKMNQATVNKYQKMLDELETKETEWTAYYKKQVDKRGQITSAGLEGLAKVEKQSADERAEILAGKENELSQNAIKFAKERADKIADLEAKAGIDRIKSREQELKANTAYWDNMERDLAKYNITAEQWAELRKSSEANINQKWDAKISESTFDYQRRLNESVTQLLLRELNKRTEEQIKQAKGDKEKLLQIEKDYAKGVAEIRDVDRKIGIQTAFDGDGLSVPLARINDQINELRRSFQGLNENEITEFREKISGLEAQRQQLQLFQGTVDNISGAFGDLFGDAIFNTEDALKNLGKAFENVAKSIITGLIKIGVRYVINQAIGTASMAATTATSAATAATVASAWATAAALVSAATFGANTVPAGIGLATLVASSKALSGFSKGGYTGSIGKDQIAGVVHGQEFVINAAATRENLPLLKAINNGMDVSGMVTSPSINYGRLNPNGVQRVAVDIPDVRIGNDAIYLSWSRGKKTNERYF